MKRRPRQGLPTDAPSSKGEAQARDPDGEGATGLVPDGPDAEDDDEALLLASARRRLARDNPELLRITKQIAARLAEDS